MNKETESDHSSSSSNKKLHRSATIASMNSVKELKLIRTLTEGWKKHVEHDEGVVNKVLVSLDVKKHQKKSIEGDIPGNLLLLLLLKMNKLKIIITYI